MSYGLSEQTNRVVQVLPGSQLVSRQSSQVEVMSAKVSRGLVFGTLNLGALNSRCKCDHHLFRDRILQLEHVLLRAIEPVGPQMGARRSLDKLPGDAQPAARLAHTSFQHIGHTQLSANLL